MGSASGESFLLFCSAVCSERAKDENIGGDKDRKDEHTHQPTAGSNKKTKDVSGRAGEFQQREKVTDEVVNDTGATGQPDSKINLKQSVKKASGPDHGHQEATHLPVHCDGVLQGLADGHVAVIGPHHEQEDLNSSKEMLCKELSHTPTEGDGFLLSK